MCSIVDALLALRRLLLPAIGYPVDVGVRLTTSSCRPPLLWLRCWRAGCSRCCTSSGTSSCVAAATTASSCSSGRFRFQHQRRQRRPSGDAEDVAENVRSRPELVPQLDAQIVHDWLQSVLMRRFSHMRESRLRGKPSQVRKKGKPCDAIRSHPFRSAAAASCI